MITVDFKPAKAEIHISTPDDSSEAAQDQPRKNQPAALEGRSEFYPQHKWAQGYPKLSLLQKSVTISLGEPILWYLLLSPVIT